MKTQKKTKTNMLTSCSGQDRSRPRPLYILPHTHPPPALLSNKDGAQDIYIIHQDRSRPRSLYICPHTNPPPALLWNKDGAQDIYIIHLLPTPLYSTFTPSHPGHLREQNHAASDLATHPYRHTYKRDVYTPL